MATIPNQYIKKLLNKSFRVNITDDGAKEIARILEKEAQRISKYAVQNAKKDNRGKVTKKDIMAYIINKGLHG